MTVYKSFQPRTTGLLPLNCHNIPQQGSLQGSRDLQAGNRKKSQEESFWGLQKKTRKLENPNLLKQGV